MKKKFQNFWTQGGITKFSKNQNFQNFGSKEGVVQILKKNQFLQNFRPKEGVVKIFKTWN